VSAIPSCRAATELMTMSRRRHRYRQNCRGHRRSYRRVDTIIGAVAIFAIIVVVDVSILL